MKGQVVPVPKRYTMKEYVVSGGKAPRNLSIVTKRAWIDRLHVVNGILG